MALRDQPYFPFYVQDFITDEKLTNCSAESTGVYIRLMCAMHKSEEYGKILLRQKDRQTDRQTYNFAVMLARQMPYNVDVIERSLVELLEERVIYMDGDTIYQKRMVKDAELSEKRAKSGKKGAEQTNKRYGKNKGFAVDFDAAKTAATTENEIVVVNEYENKDIDDGEISKSKDSTDLARVMNFFLDRINPMPSRICIDELTQFTKSLGADVVLHALNIAIDERKTAFSYIRGILSRYERDGIKTMDDVLRAEQEHAEKKENRPKPQRDEPVPAFTPPEKRHKPYNLADMVEWPTGSNNYIPKSEAIKLGY
jgi:DnaD/phage-associated family protein